MAGSGAGRPPAQTAPPTPTTTEHPQDATNRRPMELPPGLELPPGYQPAAPPDPEGALLGAVLWLAPADALAALALVRSEDFADPRLPGIAELAGQLARDGVRPDPTAVLALARRQGRIATAEGTREMALQLAA